MDSTPIRLLCIEDDPDDEILVRLATRKLKTPVEWSTTDRADGVQAALDRGVDVVLSDYHIDGYSPLLAMAAIRERGLDIPLVVVSNAVGETAAVEVLRAGAADYVSKDRLGILPMVITRVLEARRQREIQRELLKKNQVSAQRLRQLATELVETQERERKHLAQTLHDSLGQTLTALQLHLIGADDETDPAAAARLRQKSLAILRDIIGQMRTLSFAVRPAQLDHYGLAETISSMANQMLDPVGIRFELDVVGKERQRGSSQSSMAFRIVQEAFSNAIKHAQPSCIVVHLNFRPDGYLVVAVGNDGRGFAGSRRGLPHAGTAGRGLIGIAEHCELSGGSMRIRGKVSVGTVLRATLGTGL